MSPSKRIPSLDGLRAVSVAVVMMWHCIMHPENSVWAWWAGNSASLAVSVFFFISGLLITGQLLDWERRTGVIDLRKYYLRRFFRIVPPLYAFLFVVAIFSIADWKNLFTAATFTYGYSPWGRNEWLGHTWSLSIEEQFYLFWPAVLAFAGLARARWVAIGLLLAAPLLRIGHYLLFPSAREMIRFVLHTRIDTIMAGCCVALFRVTPTFEKITRAVVRPRAARASLLFVAVISPALYYWLGGSYQYVVGYTLEAAAIAIIVLYVVQNPAGIVGRALNWRPIVHIGLISYSLYLWQQVFLIGPRVHVLRTFPFNFLGALMMAELSYITVERWSLRMRQNLEGRLAAVAAAAGD